MDDTDAVMASSIITAAARDLSKTVCTQLNAFSSNKQDIFWLKIVVGRCPYSEYPLDIWYKQVGAERETYYSRRFELKISAEALEQEPDGRDNNRLKAIGESLTDIWWESMHSAVARTDRRYIIPYVLELRIDNNVVIK